MVLQITLTTQVKATTKLSTSSGAQMKPSAISPSTSKKPSWTASRKPNTRSFITKSKTWWRKFLSIRICSITGFRTINSCICKRERRCCSNNRSGRGPSSSKTFRLSKPRMSRSGKDCRAPWMSWERERRRAVAPCEKAEFGRIWRLQR